MATWMLTPPSREDRERLLAKGVKRANNPAIIGMEAQRGGGSKTPKVAQQERQATGLGYDGAEAMDNEDVGTDILWATSKTTRACREMMAMLTKTHLYPARWDLDQDLLVAGQQYYEEVDRKKQAGQAMEAPPYLTKAIVLLDHTAKFDADGDPQTALNVRAIKQARDKLGNMKVQDALEIVQMCFHARCYRKEGDTKEPMARLTFRFDHMEMVDGNAYNLMKAVHLVLQKMGSDKKNGPAPPDKHERAIRQSLQRLFPPTKYRA